MQLRDWNPLTDFFGNYGYEMPGYELEEAPEHYLLSLDMPGVPRDQIKIEVQNGLLTLAGERRQKDSSGQGYGRFNRAFKLPNGVDAEAIEANYEDGVLSLYLPKAAAAKPRQVKIGAGKESGAFAKLFGPKKDDQDHAA